MEPRGRAHYPGLLCVTSQTLNRMTRSEGVSRIDHNVDIIEQRSIGLRIVTKRRKALVTVISELSDKS